MVLVPRRIRPNQVIQAFVSILRMEFDSEYVNVRLSIVRDNVEYTGGSLRFDRPSSRLMQLQVIMIIIIMSIYHGLINALCAHIIHINLNTIFYTRVEDSPTETIDIRHYMDTHTHTQ